MASLLSSKTTEDYASEYVLVEEGGENLVLSLGNLLHSTAPVEVGIIASPDALALLKSLWRVSNSF